MALDDSRTGNAVFTWDSRTQGAEHAFAFFREEMSGRVPEITPELDKGNRKRFQCSVVSTDVSARKLTTIRCTSHRVLRAQSHVRAAERSMIILGLQMSGRAAVSRDRLPEQTLHPGELFILDGRRPFTIDHQMDPAMEVASIDLPDCQATSDVLDRSDGLIRLSQIPVFGGLAEQSFRSLAMGIGCLSKGDAAKLLAVLLALIEAGLTHGIKDRQTLSFEAILQVVRRHMAHPGFDVSLCATMLGISKRSLQRAFSARDTTFGRVLLQARINQASALLVDPGLRTKTIAAIAYSVGFDDLSHFNHAFRDLRGCSPREFRSRTIERPDGLADRGPT